MLSTSHNPHVIVQNTLIKNVQVHVSMCVHYVCMHVCIYVCIHVYTVYVHVCMNVYIHVCTCMYVHMYVCFYTQIFTPVHKRTDMNGFSPVLVKLKTCYSSS